MNRVFRALAALMLVLPTAAMAQGVPCGPSERVQAFLNAQGERVRATGTAGRGAQMALHAAETGRWSLVLHLPDGRSCILANGNDFVLVSGDPAA